VELTVTQDQLMLIYAYSGLTSVDGELISNCAPDTALTGNIRVEANLVRRAAVVHPGRLDQDLDVDFAQVLRHCSQSAPTPTFRTIIEAYHQRTQQQNSPPSSPCDPDSACGTQAAYPKQ
jgi:hypothetical protein